ncbi:c-type cytochrome [Ramlibacter sp. MMS24-I3-19]|uniref:c-type cytochrome n=1 Tax=Ramlibacter sp. MMS24-I3-19 TaxID=3416606 RepID=UPI003D01510B
MHEYRISWRNPLVRWSISMLVALTVLCLLVGFLWLPSVHKDFTAQGLWASICRAAGVPSAWQVGGAAAPLPPQATQVALDRSMVRSAGSDSVGRGATLALNCTMCHGAQGMSTSNAPNLAGQYPEVVIKQLRDYKAGKRASPIMVAISKSLSERDIDDLAAYYTSLPKARTAPTTYDESLPALVRVGAPLRNIAPCISCHGGVDQKLGAPWIEGMPKVYLVEQLRAFRSGGRRSDIEGQMRAVARTLTDAEIDEVSTFYAGKAAVAGR